MRRLGVAVALFMGLASISTQAVAQPSFAGTWKLNLAKSQLTGQTLSVEKTASGLLHFDSQGYAYDFDLTGKEFPTPDGGTSSWKEVNPTTWEATNKLNGKVVATYHLALKGDAIAATMKATKPEGGTVEQTSMWTRVSGGPGFFGKWKSTEVKGAPTTMEIALEGTSGITVKYPEFQVACKGELRRQGLHPDRRRSRYEADPGVRKDRADLNHHHDQAEWQAVLYRRPDAFLRRQHVDGRREPGCREGAGEGRLRAEGK